MQALVKFSNLLAAHELDVSRGVRPRVSRRVVDAMDRLDGARDRGVAGGWVPGESGNLDVVHPRGLAAKARRLEARLGKIEGKISEGERSFTLGRGELEDLRSERRLIRSQLSDIQRIKVWFEDRFG